MSKAPYDRTAKGQSSEADPTQYKIDILANRIIVTELRGRSSCSVELPSRAQNFGLYLANFDPTEISLAQLISRVVQHWESILRALASQLNRHECISITKQLIGWVGSTGFESVWKSATRFDRDAKDFGQICEQIEYDLTRLVAEYSEKSEDVWPFVEHVMSQGALRKGERSHGLWAERTVLSTIYVQNQVPKRELFEDEQFDRMVSWFRDRLDLMEAEKLIRAKRKHNRVESKRIRQRLRQARAHIKQDRKIQARKELAVVLSIEPRNRCARQMARRIGMLEDDSSRQKEDRDITFVLRPLLAFIIPWLLIAAYGIPRLKEMSDSSTSSEVVTATMSIQSGLLNQFAILVAYGIALSLILFFSLRSPLLPEPLRSLLLLTFLSSAIPSFSTGLWAAIVNLPDHQLALYVLIAGIVVFIFSYRDVYLEVLDTTNDTRESAKRTIMAFSYVAAQAMIYALIFSDLAARQLFYQDSQSEVWAHGLMTDYLGGVIPKLIIVPIIPTVKGLCIHLLPSVTLLWWLSSLALGTMEEGVIPFLAVWRRR